MSLGRGGKIEIVGETKADPSRKTGDDLEVGGGMRGIQEMVTKMRVTRTTTEMVTRVEARRRGAGSTRQRGTTTAHRQVRQSGARAGHQEPHQV